MHPWQSLIVVNAHAPRPMRLLDADLGKLDQEVFKFACQVLCGPRCHGRLLREQDDLPIFGQAQQQVEHPIGAFVVGLDRDVIQQQRALLVRRGQVLGQRDA